MTYASIIVTVVTATGISMARPVFEIPVKVFIFIIKDFGKSKTSSFFNFL